MLLQSERPTRTASGLRCSQKPTHGLIRQSYRAKFKSVRIQATVREHSAEASGHQRVLSLALKEWAVTCAALGKGDQTIILRKGGIRESTFKAPADTFLLFPTSFHSKAKLLTPKANCSYQEELALEPKDQSELAISYLATVTGCWATFDPAVLAALSQHHVWTEKFLDSRLRWRPKQPITVLELHCSRLPQPLTVQNEDKYWGCFSWVDLAQGVTTDAIQSAQPVLSSSESSARQQAVRTALQTLKDCSEIPVPASDYS